MKPIRNKNSNFTDKTLAVTLSTAVFICCIAGITAGCSANTEKTESTETEDIVVSSEAKTESSAPATENQSDKPAPTTTATETTIDPVIAELRDEFVAELALIPESHLAFLKERGWKFELTTKDLAEEYDYPNYICGITLYEEKIIYIDADEWAIRRSTIHEVGHAIGFELGWVESGEEFREIYEDEKDYFSDCTAVGDGHEISNVYEYFASVYQNMILDYDDTKSEVPRTVEYIEKCLVRIPLVMNNVKLY